MESEGSSPHSQAPATHPNPGPDQTSPCPQPTSCRSSLILPFHLHLCLPNCLFPSGTPTKKHCMQPLQLLILRNVMGNPRSCHLDRCNYCAIWTLALNIPFLDYAIHVNFSVLGATRRIKGIPRLPQPIPRSVVNFKHSLCPMYSVINNILLTHVMDKLLCKWDTPCYTRAQHSTHGTLLKIENTVIQT